MVFHKAIERAEKAENVKERVEHLIDSITYSAFMYTSRGLFERDKLIFTSQVAFQVGRVDVRCPLTPISITSIFGKHKVGGEGEQVGCTSTYTQLFISDHYHCTLR